ncbi:hypothetical protein P9X10_00350 [Bacillus cereus]|nr:hypothetical protein [Bacillus cereus]
MSTETESMQMIEKAVELKVKLLLLQREEQRQIEFEENQLRVNGLQLHVSSVVDHYEKTFEIRKECTNKIKEIGKQYGKIISVLERLHPNIEELERTINSETVKSYQSGKYTI